MMVEGEVSRRINALLTHFHFNAQADEVLEFFLLGRGCRIVIITMQLGYCGQEFSGMNLWNIIFSVNFVFCAV